MMQDTGTFYDTTIFAGDDPAVIARQLVLGAASAPFVSVTMPAATALQVAGVLRTRPVAVDPVALDWVDRVQRVQSVLMAVIWVLVGALCAIALTDVLLRVFA